MGHQFTRGTFQSYRALEKIHIGKYERDIFKGDEFLYDGASIRYAGEEFGVPQLKGLLGDWFVVVADQTTSYVAKASGVEVHAATPEGEARGDSFTMGEADEDHSIAGTVAGAVQRREDAAAGRPQALPQQRRAAPPPADDFFAGGDSVDHGVEADAAVEGVFVDAAERALEEAPDDTVWAKAQAVHGSGGGPDTPMSSVDSARVAAANEENRRRIQDTEAALCPRVSRDQIGGTRHDEADKPVRVAKTGGKLKMQVLSADASEGEVVGNYNFSDGASVGREGEAISPDNTPGVNVTRVAQTQQVQQGNAVAAPVQRRKRTDRHAGAEVIPDPASVFEPQAARAANTTQVQADGNDDISMTLEGGATGDVAETRYGDDLADLLPNAAMAGRRAPPAQKPPTLTDDEEIAEITQNWNKKRHWKKRVKEALDFYGDWPEAIDAICAIESDAVIKHIRSKIK